MGKANSTETPQIHEVSEQMNETRRKKPTFQPASVITFANFKVELK